MERKLVRKINFRLCTITGILCSLNLLDSGIISVSTLRLRGQAALMNGTVGQRYEHRLPYCDNLYRCCLFNVLLVREWEGEKG